MTMEEPMPDIENEHVKNEHNIKFFISHLSEDFQIANALRSELEDWGVKNKDIYLAQLTGAGMPIGNDIDASLAKVLFQTKVFFLIYTYSDRNWQYPFYELGLSIDPTKDTTRLVIFLCTDDEPKVTKNTKKVMVTQEGIEDFTYQFHQNKEFIPGENKEWDPDLSDDNIQKRSKRLYEALKNSISTARKRVENLRWPHIRLLIPSKSVEDISKIRDPLEAEQIVTDMLGNIVTIKDISVTASEHFDLAGFPPKATFGEMASNWNAFFSGKYEFPKDEEWIRGFARGIWRGICATRPKPITDAPLKSARDQNQYHLLVTSIIDLPDDSVEVFALMIETTDEVKMDKKVLNR